MSDTTTTYTDGSARRMPIVPLSHYDPAVEARVQQWFASGRMLAWIPILSRENFPEVPPEILHWADAYQPHLRWPIHRPEDLLDLPEGVTGWLLPMEVEDTDVSCGVWAGKVYILGVKDRCAGRPQTLLGERADEATAGGNQSAV